MSNEPKFAKSKDALEKFMECLHCKQCNQVANDPVRFVTCSHFFCAKCLPNNVETCLFCNVPIKPTDIQSDYMVNDLIKNSMQLYNLLHLKKYIYKENVTDNSKATVRGRKKKSTDNAKAKGKKSDEFDATSVSSISKSSKFSESKESLFTDVDDSVVLSKRMLQRLHKPNQKGEVPLHTACVKNNKKLVKALLDAGANPNVKDNAKLTPLQEAASYGYYEICEMLLQSGAQPNIPGINNQTALHSAIERNNVREAELLIKFGASLRPRDDHGKTPEDYCNSDEMRQILFSAEDLSDEISICNTSLNATIINSISESHSITVLPVNLEPDNIELLKQVAAKHKMNIVTSFRETVTHVVVKSNSECSADLSFDICMAILSGKWIVMFEWINILADQNDVDIDPSIFEVTNISHSMDTLRKARENEQQKNPRLFNNCTFYFSLNNKWTYRFGSMELTKDNIIRLATEGEGKVLKRMPRPQDIEDNEIVPFHASKNSNHPLHKCSHYIIYEPGLDQPKLMYNMKDLKVLPLVWFIDSIQNFQLMDPINYGL